MKSRKLLPVLILLALLISATLLCLTSCDGQDSNDDGTSSEATTPEQTAGMTESSTDETVTAQETTTTETSEATMETTTTEAVFSDTEPETTVTDAETLSETTAEPETTAVETTEPDPDPDRDFIAGFVYPSYKLLDSDVKAGYTGRWFDKQIKGVEHRVTLNDGSEFYFLINGSVSVNIEFTVITTGKTPYYAYSIDGSDPVRSLITNPEIKLPDTGRHIVRVICDGMTEGEGKWDQEKGFALKDIVPSDGGTVRGLIPDNKVIAFYGDSITEGIRALNMNADSDGNSATNAYPWYCASELGAIAYNVGTEHQDLL